MSEIFYDFKKIHQITGKSRTSVWRWIQNGDFPPSYQIGRNSVAWKKSDVDAWIEAKTTKGGESCA